MQRIEKMPKPLRKNGTKKIKIKAMKKILTSFLLILSIAGYSQAPTRGALVTMDTTVNKPTIKMLAVNILDNTVVYWNLSYWASVGGSSGGVSSVGLSVTTPANPAFSVSNSPITSSGNIALNILGNTSQYIRGDGSLATYGAATTVPISGLTAATATNTIDNTTYPQIWNWTGLTQNALLLSAVTTATLPGQTLFSASLSGANAAAGRTTYAANIQNLHTGTSSTNYALLLNATGGTSANYALVTNNGDVLLNRTSGTTTFGTAGGASGIFNVQGSGSGTITFQPQAAAGTYNWNWPTTAGTSGQPLLSGGGGSTAMSFGTLSVAGGGTGNTATATNTYIPVGDGTKYVPTAPSSLTGLPYVALTGTSTATGAMTLNMGGLNLTVSNSDEVKIDGGNILDLTTTHIGTFGDKAGSVYFKASGTNEDNKVYILSPAIAAATPGDALTVVNPATGELGVAPNLAFNLRKEGTMIYAKNGRVYSADNSGNETLISPHDKKGNWVYESTNVKTGVTTKIDMIKLATVLEKVSGEKLIYKTNKKK